jgi:hypothetical protein
MRSAKSTGRIVGLLLFAQFVGLMLGFIQLSPITTPDFLENAVAASAQIRVSVLILFAVSALTIGIAIFAFPVVREHSPRMALWLVALSVIWFAMQAVDNQYILSMVSVSRQYGVAEAASAEAVQTVGTALRSTRRWAHYTELLVIDIWFFLFCMILFRFSLVPRLLAGFGLAMVLVHTAAVTLPAFVGYRQVLLLAYSLVLSYVVLVTWLLVKGFPERGVRVQEPS